jgi:hypothetical protein
MNTLTNTLTNTIKLIKDNIVNIELAQSEYLDIINRKDNEIQQLKNKIIEQDKKIIDLVEKVKSKSSSAIWESMQLQLQDKDKMIDQFKKDIDFYKRQYLVKNSETAKIEDSTISHKHVEKIDGKIDDEIDQFVREELKKKKKKDKKEKKDKNKKIESEDLDDLERDLLN